MERHKVAQVGAILVVTVGGSTAGGAVGKLPECLVSFFPVKLYFIDGINF